MPPKRTPSDVIVHRIELQDTERSLIESYMYMEQANKFINSISKMGVKELYFWLTIAESLGLISTPIPTLGEEGEGILNAIKTWGTNVQAAAEEAGKSGNWFERNLSDQALIPKIWDFIVDPYGKN